MMYAFNELYLNDAQLLLANAFDYAINDCNKSPEMFSNILVKSSLIKEYEIGNPAIISGKSSVELVRELLTNINIDEDFPNKTITFNRSKEYWAGWALSYYQWISCKRFKDIFSKVSLDEILMMYKVYHEMDISSFVEAMDKKINSIELDTKLKKIRESRGLSQHELARLSGVNFRSIQLYEQKVNDIDKAQVQTIYKLSRVLGCNIEDLLENPERN